MVLFDSGSQSNFITIKLTKIMDFERETIDITVIGVTKTTLIPKFTLRETHFQHIYHHPNKSYNISSLQIRQNLQFRL